MLSVKTNRDIEQYKSDVAGGFDIKETLFIALGVVIGIVIMLLLSFFTNIPLLFIPYIAAPFVMIPIVSCFYNKDGMGFLQHRKKINEMQKGSPVPYRSTENAENYEKYLVMATEETEKNSDEAFDKTLKKLKIGAIIFAIALVGICVAIVLAVKK